jgi:predicted metal-dependent hydrolase
MTIKINPIKPMVVVAPLGVDPAKVREFVVANAVWIGEKMGKSRLECVPRDELRYIVVSGKQIPYHIQVNNRAKRIILKITAEKSVTVVTPAGTNPLHIHRFVQKKAEWIEERINSHFKPVAPPRLYQNDDLIPLLGNDVRLSVRIGVSRPDIHLKEGAIEVSIPDNLSELAERQSIRQLLEFLLKKTLHEVSSPMIRSWSVNLGIPVPQVRYGNQKTRWGVCTSKGIILNIRLAMAPIELIEYVVVHELCHMKHHNHSKMFWRLVGEMLPDYPERLARLKRDGNVYRL